MARLSALDKVRRDARIVADRARGFGWAAIGERNGVSDRHCRQIWQDHWSSHPPLDNEDPLETVREALAQQESLIEDLARLAETARHDAVRLGSLKAKREAIRDRLALMQAVGLLPRDIGHLRQEADIRQIIRGFEAAFARHDLPDEVEDDLLEAFRSASVRQVSAL